MDIPFITRRHGLEKPEDALTFSQRAADWLASSVGSWGFLIGNNLFVGVWIGANVWAGWHHWDAYPFILLNLIFSWFAQNATPVILMSQNRQADRDRLLVKEIRELVGQIKDIATKDLAADTSGLETESRILERLDRIEAKLG